MHRFLGMPFDPLSTLEKGHGEGRDAHESLELAQVPAESSLIAPFPPFPEEGSSKMTLGKFSVSRVARGTRKLTVAELAGLHRDYAVESHQYVYPRSSPDEGIFVLMGQWALLRSRNVSVQPCRSH